MDLYAITRAVSPAFEQCALTHLDRRPIDYRLAALQHEKYEEALASLGVKLLRLAADAALPDCVFVEDAAVVTPDFAVVTRPGHEARRPEVAAVAALLPRFRPVSRIESPGTLDGGDVLLSGKRLFVGSGDRSNAAGIAQLEAIARPYGYRVQAVPVHGCLHLKTAVTLVGPNLLLINPEWVDRRHFADFDLVTVDPTEPMGANGLLIGETLMYARGYERTAAKLEAAGAKLRLVDISEFAKAEGAVTCCSVVFSAPT